MWEWKARSAAWAAVGVRVCVVFGGGVGAEASTDRHTRRKLAVIQPVVVEPDKHPHCPPQELPGHARQVKPRDGHAHERVQGGLEGEAVQQEEDSLPSLFSPLLLLRSRGNEEGSHLLPPPGQPLLELARQQPRVPRVPRVARHGHGTGGGGLPEVVGHHGIPVHVVEVQRRAPPRFCFLLLSWLARRQEADPRAVGVDAEGAEGDGPVVGG